MDNEVIISYAQNFEDVMLWRALKHIPNGFYVDIGAYDPVEDSVTKLFYDNGWTGINVEPSEEAFQKLTINRPKDLNLNVGASNINGKSPYFYVPNTGWSTTNVKIANLLRQRSVDFENRTINVLSLNTILSKKNVTDIHFLKIDIEGDEKKILQNFDFIKYRPWIFLIESNLPNSTEQVHHSWENILLANNYSFVYYDGLNRYYISDEKYNLLSVFFDKPPNVFDNFERYSEWSLKNENRLKDKLNDEMKKRLDDSKQIIQGESIHNKDLLSQIHQLKSLVAQHDITIADTKQESITLQNKNKILQEKLSTNEDTKQMLSIKVSELSEKNNQKAKLIEEISQHNTVLQTKTQFLQNEVAAYLKSEEHLNIKIGIHLNNISTLENLNKQKDILQKDLAIQNQSLGKKINKLKKNISSLKEEIKNNDIAHQNLLEKVQTNLKKERKSIKKYNTKQAKLNTYSKDLKKVLDSKSKQIEQFQQEKQNTLNHIHALQNELQIKTQTIKQHQTQQQNITNHNHALQNELNIQTQTIEQHQIQQKDITNHNHALQNELNIQVHAVQELQHNQGLLSNKLQILQTELADKINVINGFEAHKILFQTRVHDIEKSLSWKITTPIRWLTKYPMDWYYSRSSNSINTIDSNLERYSESNILIETPIKSIPLNLGEKNFETPSAQRAPSMLLEASHQKHSEDNNTSINSLKNDANVRYGNILDFVPRNKIQEINDLLHENTN